MGKNAQPILQRAFSGILNIYTTHFSINAYEEEDNAGDICAEEGIWLYLWWERRSTC